MRDRLNWVYLDGGQLIQVTARRRTQQQVATSLSTPGVTGLCEPEPGRATPSLYRIQETSLTHSSRTASLLVSDGRQVALWDSDGETIRGAWLKGFQFPPSWSPLHTSTWLQRPAPGLPMSTSCTRSWESKFSCLFMFVFNIKGKRSSRRPPSTFSYLDTLIFAGVSTTTSRRGPVQSKLLSIHLYRSRGKV